MNWKKAALSLLFLLIFNVGSFSEPIEIDYSLRERVARVEEQVKAIKDSISVALATSDKRLDGMNEFRQTLSDQAGRFVTRTEILGIVSTGMFMTIAIITLILKFINK